MGYERYQEVGLHTTRRWRLWRGLRGVQPRQIPSGGHNGFDDCLGIAGLHVSRITYKRNNALPQLDNNIEKAARYLINNFRSNNNLFYDSSVVGTGHRGILNLQYPIYAYSFPLVAISRLRSYIRKEKTPYYNEEVIR